MSSHSCIHCQTRFLIHGQKQAPSRRLVGDADNEWPVSNPPNNLVTVTELARLAAEGCVFSRYLLEKLAPEEENFLQETPITRYSPDLYEAYPNSLIFWLSNEKSVCLTIIVEEGKMNPLFTISNIQK